MYCRLGGFRTMLLPPPPPYVLAKRERHSHCHDYAPRLVCREWNQEIVSVASASLLESLPLDGSAPGGMIEYRRSLTLSFFFKFYLSVADCVSRVRYIQLVLNFGNIKSNLGLIINNDTCSSILVHMNSGGNLFQKLSRFPPPPPLY